MLKFHRLLDLRRVGPLQLRKYSVKVNRGEKAEKHELQALYPEKLLGKKHKTPNHMYLANEKAADLIDSHIEPFLQQTPLRTVLEFNPGLGLFTHKLVNRGERYEKIILLESLEHFVPNLMEFQSLYPARVSVKQGDLVNMWKLVYQDKMDNGNRVMELLQDVPRRSYEDDTNMLVFGTVGSYAFFKDLISSVIFQNSLLSFGRCEMFLVMPPPIYIHLTCNNEVGYMFYRSSSILFQMLFEYRFITQIPRAYFLPKQTGYSSTKGSKLARIASVDPEYLYLVRIVPRRNLFDLIAGEDLQSLWYFVKQNCVSRGNRVIPNIEKWVPGCGPRLIVNSEQSEKVELLYNDVDLDKLPQFSKQCTTMTCRDFFPNMNIYTQFGDLSPSQMLTLFTQFRHWPEYSESSFLASLENSMLKMEISNDDSIEGIAEEDDCEVASVAEEMSVDIPVVETKKTPGRKKRAKTSI